MISAIVLAAGESRRMGDFKQVLRLRDKTFVEHCVDNLLASRVDEVIVVTGFRELAVRQAIGSRPVKFAHNREYRSGMASSIKRGVEALFEGARACVLSLVDQPQIGAEVINRVIESYQAAPTKIVIPTYEGRNGHPILLDLSLKEAILAMDPEKGLRNVIRAHSNEILRVEVSDPAVLEDCDSPDDYKRILEQ